MVSVEDALQILEEENTPEDVIEHCKAVARKAVSIAKKIKEAGTDIDINLVETGALLHDIGRSQTHSINHGHIGGIIIRDRGLKDLAHIVERHIGAGITKQEAKKLGLPPKDYIPKTLEEKVVSNADNQISGTHAIPIWNTVQDIRNDVSDEVAERVSDLYREIETLMVSSA